MKKLLSVIMLVCIVMSMCTVSAWATGTPTATVVGGASFTSLADALNAAPTGSTIELSSGAYNITSVSNKALTIKAAANTDRLSVVINISGTPAFHGCSLSFSGVTLVCENTDYRGMQHLSSLTVDNCVIKNQFFSYAPTASFSGCTFEQPSAGNYNIWTYNSENISFTNCQFNSAGKSMLVYHEGTSTKTVNVSACMFNNTASSAVAGKAAIELDSTFHQIILNIDTQTAASGFDANSLCGNELWNEKANNGTAVQGGQATVVKNGAKIYENKTHIAMPPVDPNPDPGVNPNPNNPAPVTPAAPVVEDIYYIPATDDNSNMALWSILTLALLSTAFVTRKRKNEN